MFWHIEILVGGDFGDAISYDETEYDTIAEASQSKEIILSKPVLYLSDLARKDPRILKKKSYQYLWHVLTIALFYGLPVVQLVITYQKVQYCAQFGCIFLPIPLFRFWMILATRICVTTIFCVLIRSVSLATSIICFPTVATYRLDFYLCVWFIVEKNFTTT